MMTQIQPDFPNGASPEGDSVPIEGTDPLDVALDSEEENDPDNYEPVIKNGVLYYVNIETGQEITAEQWEDLNTGEIPQGSII